MVNAPLAPNARTRILSQIGHPIARYAAMPPRAIRVPGPTHGYRPGSGQIRHVRRGQQAEQGSRRDQCQDVDGVGRGHPDEERVRNHGRGHAQDQKCTERSEPGDHPEATICRPGECPQDRCHGRKVLQHDRSRGQATRRTVSGPEDRPRRARHQSVTRPLTHAGPVPTITRRREARSSGGTSMRR